MRIDSPSNARVVAAVRAIAQGEAIPLEGDRMLMDALDAAIAPREVFHLEEANAPLLARAARAGAELVAVSPRVLAKLSDLPSTRGIVALASLPRREASEVPLPKGALAIALDGVQDPANVGAILRSAEAFGCTGALLTEGCANPFAARALRASSGSALRVPIATGLSPAEVVAWARERSAALAGADAHGGAAVAPRKGTTLLVIGSEGRGLSPELSDALDARLTIPLGERTESLNAAVAAGILLYALTR